jgi:hypothetical protein
LSYLGRVFHKLRVWAGLADASLSHITPSHGWLLAEPAVARDQRKDFEAERAARLRERNGRA